ncbi:S8 family serine peptidase [Marinigracilibium pacificum]|uniref:S8 family serine peptidase n=1 Tax=Marinigracilibium pacificum TaxID=2729599 RepID=A0A848IZB5_9BACT|nr:S8 family serine peptidase [Marinigracilibium pacificum]NMM47339.1 S8 family serine peptidase [Marinigracilibium pacificum]
MIKYLQLKTSHLVVLLLFCFSAVNGFSQVTQGKVHIKFKPGMEATVSNMKVSRTANGIVQIGLSGFDAVASQYKAVEIKPMFVPKKGREEAHRRHGLHLWYEVTIDENSDVLSSVNAFGNIAEVIESEPIYAKTFVEPSQATEVALSSLANNAPVNDPGLADQWHYENDGSNNGIPEADINLFQAWNTTKGASNVIVSVHDQGVDASHEDLAANMWVNEAELNGEPGVDDDFNGYVDDIHGYDFVNNSGNVPGEEHGTHVAGTIAAVNNNGIGVAGVAGGSGSGDGTRIMTMKAIGGNMAASFVYAADNGAVISQNSWTYTIAGVYEQATLDAIDYFIAEAGSYPGSPMKGGIVIFAAGNYNQNQVYYPEAYEKVMAVAALGPANKKAYYSNYASWVDIAAPGGDQSQIYGNKGGILSTLPNNSYGFYQGTSMACPHVSGIAALVVAARGGSNFTNADLWTHLITGTRDIYQYNDEAYAGFLGVGYIDAALAIEENEGVGPDMITDLSASTVSQDFVELNWTSVGDQDDATVFGYEIYYSTDSMKVAQKNGHETIIISDKNNPGIVLSQVIEDLIPETKYYFAISGYDRWGNKGNISEVISATTTDAPEIAFDVTNFNITLDNSNAHTSSEIFNVINNAEGALKWNAVIRQTKPYALSTTNLNYPMASSSALKGVEMMQVANTTEGDVNAEVSDYNNNWENKFWRVGRTVSSIYIIGEEDTSIPNSAAMKYTVDDPEGFNLTRISQFMNLDRTQFPQGVLEIYQGESIEKKNLVLAQSFDGNYGEGGRDNTVTLDYQLFFEQGETFWVVFHMPTGIKYPLGIGQETNPTDSDNCFMSFDVGETWVPLAEAIEDDRWVWRQELQSTVQPIHEYLTLSQADGVTPGLSQEEITVNADGTSLINGKYYASAVFYSNDDNQRIADIDFTINVNDHKPVLSSSQLVDFGSTFVGVPTTLEIPLVNSGLGVFRFNDPSCVTTNADFDLGGTSKSGIPASVKALDSDVLTVTFTPTSAGNISGQIQLVDYNGNTHTINVSGVGTQPSEIAYNPASSDFTMAIGEVQSGSFDIVNNGNYPLQFYFPRLVSQEDVIQVPVQGSSFGYFWENTKDAGATHTYQWEDISQTGKNVTAFWRDQNGRFLELDLGFQFPYFEQVLDKLYLTQYGVLVTRTDIGWVGNSITPGNPTSNVPISALNRLLRLEYGGDIYIQRKSGKIIIQYENVRVASGATSAFTFQTIIYNNGDIVHNYKAVPSASFYRTADIAIEDPDKKFGSLIYDKSSYTDTPDAGLTNESSIKIYSPGVDAIENVSMTYGVVPVGESQTINFDVNSANLVEGNWYQKLVVASNDPVNPLSAYTANINVNAGGVVDAQLAETSYDFGTIFQGDSVGRIFELENVGTKGTQITGISSSTGSFILEHDALPVDLQSKTIFFLSASHDGVAQGTFTDQITFTFADGSQETLDLAINVGPAPAITVTTDPIDYNLNVGETAAHTVTIQNNGEAELEFTTSGTEWAYFNDETVATSAAQLKEHSYIFKTNLDDGSVGYNWEELVGGDSEKLDDGTISEWHTRALPFEFKFYGNVYDTIYIHSNGVITFDDYTDLVMEGPVSGPAVIPDPGLVNNAIAPFWGNGYYSGIDAADREISGVFFKEYDDYVIVEFARLVDRAYTGMPFSVQAIIYKNGNIKYQYKFGTRSRAHEAVVGIENADGTDGVQVMSYDFFLEDKMAIVFSPANKRRLAAGSSVELPMTIDATHTNGGTYSANLQIQSNVPGNLNTFIPASLTVTGLGEINVIDSLYFGDIVAETLPNGNTITHDIDFVLTNSGSDLLTVNTAELTEGTDYSLSMLQVFCGFRGCTETLTPVDGAITLSLQPGEEQLFRLTLNTRLETYEAIDTVAFDLGLATEVKVPVYANVFLPSVLELDNDTFHYEASDNTFTASDVINLNNADGQNELIYDITYNYIRGGSTMATQMTSTSEEVNGEISGVASSSMVPVMSAANFNRDLAYGEDAVNTFIGFGPSSKFNSATKFNAGAEGFNLSHISTYISAENNTSTRMVVEVYAGNDIYDAVKVSEVEYKHDAETNFQGMVTIPLEEVVKMYPYETFWVVVNYPYGVSYPQGTNTTGGMAGTFMYQSGAFWYDLQATPGFTEQGWYVKAHEETYSKIGWLTVSGSGSVPAGETGTIDISVSAETVENADVFADIVISSNDPYNPTANVRVSMHMNQAPVFDAGKHYYEIHETESIEISVTATDLEGETFEFALENAPVGMTMETFDGIANLSYTTDYLSAGVYNMSVTATDAGGRVSQFPIELNVVNVNRTPVVTDIADFNLSIGGPEYFIDGTTVFADPDTDDALYYHVEFEQNGLLDVSITGNTFEFIPKAPGTTLVTIYATDGMIDEEVSTTFTVTVDYILGTDDLLDTKFRMYPNPVIDALNVKVPENGEYTMNIYGVDGKVYMSRVIEMSVNGTSIDMSTLRHGIYVLELIGEDSSITRKIIKE